MIAGPEVQNHELDWLRRTIPSMEEALVPAEPALAPLLVDYP